MYIRVNWPESQYLMNHKRFSECLLGDVDSSVYFVPQKLYEEIFECIFN